MPYLRKHLSGPWVPAYEFELTADPICLCCDIYIGSTFHDVSSLCVHDIFVIVFNGSWP